MIYNKFALVRYDADEGKVFDWKEPRYEEDEEGNQIQTHLNVKTLFIGVDDEGNTVELTTPNDITSEKEKAYDILLGVSE